jgi:hypothetical protein
MKSLYLIGPSGSGKTALCVGLALKCREAGLKVSYFKPFGAPPGMTNREDEDAALMKEVLGLPQPLEEIVPFTAGPHFMSRYQKGSPCLSLITKAYERMREGADVVLVGGPPWVYAMASLGLDPVSLAREFGAGALIINKVNHDLALDRMVYQAASARAAGVDVVGTVCNHVPRELLDKCRAVYSPYVEDRGFKVLGIIPRRLEIACPTVGEYYDSLGGELLVGGADMDRLVEDVLVGAMTIESVLSYFRRSPNKAVITGGDRTDICLAALETSTAVLVLTGGLYPNAKVLTRAADQGVPVLLVNYDTYQTIQRLHDISRRIRPTDERSIATAKELVDKHCDWETLLGWFRQG